MYSKRQCDHFMWALNYHWLLTESVFATKLLVHLKLNGSIAIIDWCAICELIIL